MGEGGNAVAGFLKWLTGGMMGVLSVLTLVGTVMPETARAQTAEELEKLHVPLLRHRPFYIAFHDDETKVQLSFRFALGEDTNFHFAYTQVIFWSLTEDSVPVEEIRYKPEIFYRFHPGGSWLNQVNIGLDEHDSNGMDGEASRSSDTYYLETVSFLDPGRRDIRWSHRLFGYYDSLAKQNEDLAGYRSTYEMELGYHAGFVEQDRLMLRAFLRDYSALEEEESSALGLGGYEIGYRFPFPYGETGALQLYVQYYDGYAETWRGYDERSRTLRAGFMLR